jgi:hypothetical protein
LIGWLVWFGEGDDFADFPDARKNLRFRAQVVVKWLGGRVPSEDLNHIKDSQKKRKIFGDFGCSSLHF